MYTHISESFFIDIGIDRICKGRYLVGICVPTPFLFPRRLIVALLCGRYQTQSDIQMLADKICELAPLPRRRVASRRSHIVGVRSSLAAVGSRSGEPAAVLRMAILVHATCSSHNFLKSCLSFNSLSDIPPELPGWEPLPGVPVSVGINIRCPMSRFFGFIPGLTDKIKLAGILNW